MRYSVQSKGLPLTEVEKECTRCGGRNIRVASRSGQVFCELDDVGAQALMSVPGLALKLVDKVSVGDKLTPKNVIAPPGVIRAPVAPFDALYGATQAVYGASQASLASLFYDLRSYYDPAVVGTGSTVAVLDTGVRSSHRALKGKVVHEVNLTSSPSAFDGYNHGTACAFLCMGGRHSPGEECGLAPGSRVMNIKVINDEGEATSEEVVMGVEYVLDLKDDAEASGLSENDEMWPNLINMSLGALDNGDPDDPLRVACRAAVEAGVPVVASSGNAGPDPGTITTPAVDPYVFAVGVVTFSPFAVWEQSSRGPTLEGNVKPDVVFFGTNMLLASSEGDDAFVVKSGSSFAAPAICGGSGLIHEMAVRFLGAPLTVEQTYTAIPLVCRKPEGAPTDKDNSYGYGLPMGDLVLQMAGAGVSEMVTGMMVPMMALGMMGMMMSGLTKGMR